MKKVYAFESSTITYEGTPEEIANVQKIEDQENGEIDRLADFLLKKYPQEIGIGNLSEGESAVDVAIRLLSK